MLNYVLISLALTALACVVFEEKIGVSKAKVTLICGCLAWVLMFVAAPSEQSTNKLLDAFKENVSEIANLWLFLIAAMTFVVYLNKKGLIDSAIRRMLPGRMGKRRLLYFTGIFCFTFSSLADNITATLVSVALISSLQLSQKELVRFAVLVVFSVNSGGVSLISGDVTTLMIFLDDKATIGGLLSLAGPALLSVILLAGMLSFGIHDEITIDRRVDLVNASQGTELHTPDLRRIDIIIAVLFLVTIVSTMVMNIAFGIPPVLMFLTGLAIMFLISRYHEGDVDDDPIMEYIRLVEFETLFFFLGVLLIVGMLQEIGALAYIAELYTYVAPSIGTYLFGLFSSIVDNVPLTAALLKANPEMAQSDWLPLTYAVGVGGSLLIIGSASGIVCMSRIPGLTVLRYARFLPVLLIAYSAGYAGAIFVSRLPL